MGKNYMEEDLAEAVRSGNTRKVDALLDCFKVNPNAWDDEEDLPVLVVAIEKKAYKLWICCCNMEPIPI